MRFVEEEIHLPDPGIIASEILEWLGTYFSQFEDSIDATDGTHIPAKVPAVDISHINPRTF